MHKILGKIKHTAFKIVLKFKAYIKHLLFPLYLFPLKLVTYSFYYFLRLVFKLVIAFIGLIFDCIKFPFKSLKNFLKSIVYIATDLLFITAFRNTPVYTGDELNADMSSSFGGIPRSLERGGCH